MDDCVFCKIVSGEFESDTVFEDDDWKAFYDIKPSAPVHVLLIPKKHKEWQLVGEEDAAMLGRIYSVAPQVAKKVGLLDSGYKLVMNCGEGAGQIVPHFHVHLIGGWADGEVGHV